MSAEVPYSHERVRQQIGGPPLPGAPTNGQSSPIQPAQECNPTLFEQVQGAVDCACAEGTGGSLCSAVVAGQVMTQQPWSCMVDLVDQYMNCGQDISEDKRKAAYQAFVNTTGFKGVDYSQIATEINRSTADIVNLNAFYLWVPLFIVILVILWVMVGFGWLNWAVGLFMTVLAFGILYSFNIAYRIHADRILENRRKNFGKFADTAQGQFENSVAYWPQGLFASACAVTCEDGNCWSCNETPCPPGVGFSRAKGKVQYQEPELEEEDEDDEPPTPKATPKSAPIRKRRQQACRGCKSAQ